MLDHDHIQKFMFDDMPIRGQLIHLDKVLQQVLASHDYPLTIQGLIAEGLLCAILMSSSIKYRGQLTIQFQSKSALSLLLIKCSHNFQVRALAQYDANVKDPQAYEDSLINGSLVVTVEPDDKVKPYQSIVPLRGSIQQSIEHYFAQSEQIPTKFILCSTQNKAAGIMLQLMPEDPLKPYDDPEGAWQHLTTLTDTLTDKELLTLGNEDLLYRLYHQEKCRVFDTYQIQFKCPCSKARMLESIKLYGEKEAMGMLSTHKAINVKCEFCLENYAFEKHDVMYLFHQQ